MWSLKHGDRVLFSGPRGAILAQPHESLDPSSRPAHGCTCGCWTFGAAGVRAHRRQKDTSSSRAERGPRMEKDTPLRRRCRARSRCSPRLRRFLPGQDPASVGVIRTALDREIDAAAHGPSLV
jgi:hypothetical protein